MKKDVKKEEPSKGRYAFQVFKGVFNLSILFIERVSKIEQIAEPSL